MIINSVILILISIVLVWCLKIYFSINAEQKVFDNKFVLLKNELSSSEHESVQLNQRLKLSDDFNQTLFKRLFKIIKELFLVQKLIFEDRSNK